MISPAAQFHRLGHREANPIRLDKAGAADDWRITGRATARVVTGEERARRNHCVIPYRTTPARLSAPMHMPTTNQRNRPYMVIPALPRPTAGSPVQRVH